MKSIIIDRKEFYISNYSSLEDLVDTEFEGKDSEFYKIRIENIKNIPYYLKSYIYFPCSLQVALDEESETFDAIFDWVNFVEANPDEEDASIAYIDAFRDWDRDSFEETYKGKYDSEEDFAKQWLEDWGWGIDLSACFDYESFGREIWVDYNLDDFTPEALNDYRERLGLPSLDDNENLSPQSRKELELSYGFIGDDIEDEEDIMDSELENSEEMEQAEEEYNDYIEEYSFEIRLAEHDYAGVAETYIEECYGGIESYISSHYDTIMNYIDIEDLARYISLDYIFIDGYVFENI